MSTDTIKFYLNWPERFLVFKASLLLPVTEFWIRKCGFIHCHHHLSKLAGFLAKEYTNNDSLTQAQRVAKLVEYANQRYSIYIADCLTSTVVIQYLLISKGISCNIRLGVRNITGQFESHAWIEHNDIALNEPEDIQKTYTVIDWEQYKSIKTKR